MDKLRDYYNKLRNSKSFIPFIIGSSLMLILIVLLIIVTSTSSGNLTSIETTLGNKIYIDENNNFDTEVFGSGSLNNTNYSFDVYPDNIVYLTNEKLSGSKVTNQVLGLRTGVFTINITANLGLKKLKINNKQVAVCKRLSLNNFNFSEYEVILNKKSQIKLDLGNANACTSDIIYKVEDEKIATIDKNGYISGLKLGNTNLILTDVNDTVKIPLYIINDNQKINYVRPEEYSYKIKVGQTINLKAIVTPDTARNKNVTWVSSDSNIVRVTTGGAMTGVSTGKAQVIVRSVVGGYSSTASVEVE